MNKPDLIYQNRETRLILRRTIIHGTLELQSPTLISNGDSDLPTDMALLRDAAEGKALLPGSSIAGALRAYLAQFNDSIARKTFVHQSNEVQYYLTNHGITPGEAHLFGAEMTSTDSDGDQSSIIISDAISDDVPLIDVRHGVKIDSSTRTASDGAKYDLEMLRRGTTFTLRFELIEEVPFDPKTKAPLCKAEPAHSEELRRLLAQALLGLETGAIALGMRKQRGLGRCQVTGWQVWNFNMEEAAGALAWLQFDGTQAHTSGSSIVTLLNVNAEAITAVQNDCSITTTFGLDQSLLIRSASAGRYTPDDVFLVSTDIHGTAEPVIPGTSWAGVIRHRAEKIWRTLNPTHPVQKSVEVVDSLFGFVDETKHEAQRSRIRIGDSIIQSANTDYVQTRIAIDRFTGGPYPGALLVEQPVWGTNSTEITLHLTLTPPYAKECDANNQPVINKAAFHQEIGLLLLVLKDLWLGDLAVGGEQSIGRGTLRGKALNLEIGKTMFSITQNADDTLAISDPAGLQAFVDALTGVNNEH